MNVRMLKHRSVSLRGTDKRNSDNRRGFKSAPFLGNAFNIGSHAIGARVQSFNNISSSFKSA
jgi:hypothetical protein